MNDSENTRDDDDESEDHRRDHEEPADEKGEQLQADNTQKRAHFQHYMRAIYLDSVVYSVEE